MPQSAEERTRRAAPRRLPRGRHALAPEEVERIHRDRLYAAMAEAMAERGYVRTSVEDVLRRAVVSRQSFYRLFDSKLDCFMGAFERAGEILVAHVMQALGRYQDTASPGDADAKGTGGARSGGTAEDRLAAVEHALAAYLDVLARELPYARLFLVEVFAAGPEAVQRRTALQGSLAGVFADLIGARDEAGRYTCQVIVAATSAMVTPAVAAGDPEALRALGPPLTEHIRRLWHAGMFGPDDPRWTSPPPTGDPCAQSASHPGLTRPDS
ncbi:TetR/AcrR family transcriptional regulator [Actinomadura logoneensis]|uniref:TetR/AcrR family transcriptional regulator n=1 Tax=Actinomadura logoneensis TaxID=2293572 RepID=A0A372JMX2_9ACTN|nr:TetR/AcrR family transcriptional regulator [Actinomadura logoneensis]RFU40698.1 TetR/AcrR family transcriptional regulator [Actinomadura logoneensis]